MQERVQYVIKFRNFIALLIPNEQKGNKFYTTAKNLLAPNSVWMGFSLYLSISLFYRSSVQEPVIGIIIQKAPLFYISH